MGPTCLVLNVYQGFLEPGISFSIVAERPEFDSREKQGREIYLSDIASRPVLGFTLSSYPMRTGGRGFFL
jgi:hypothetical protein